MLERLQKIISAAGVTSRRAAETLIAEGRVRVNGKVVTELGTKADPSKDHIKVDGKLINPQQPPTYLMLNKPAGYVTTMSDPEGRPTVQDLLKGVKTRVYPVGRLDYNTEGLLLLTNDGDFAHLITHPKHEFPKTYLAKIKGVLDDRMIGQLEDGMFLADGKTAPARVRKIRKEEANSWVEITIHEGRKRQVRRMFDHIGRSVIKLKRTRTGSLPLGDLPEGRFRHLTPDEVRSLRETAEKTDVTGRTIRVYNPEGKKPDREHAGQMTPVKLSRAGEQKIDARRPRIGSVQDTKKGRRQSETPAAGARTGYARTDAQRSLSGFKTREGGGHRKTVFQDVTARTSDRKPASAAGAPSKRGFGRRASDNPAPWHRPAPAGGGKRFLATVKKESPRVSTSGRSRYSGESPAPAKGSSTASWSGSRTSGPAGSGFGRSGFSRDRQKAAGRPSFDRGPRQGGKGQGGRSRFSGRGAGKKR